MNRFYLIVPIGLEDLALEELKKASVDLQFIFDEKAVLHDIITSMGGIEFNIDFHVGLLLNHILKIPSRVLLRWEQFKAKDFPTLSKKLNSLKWNQTVFQNGIGELVISASRSKLNNEKRIKKVLVEEVFKIQNISYDKTDEPDLYLRMHDDLLQLSIDTTGEHLHFRGYRENQGEAPLRENFAAALWFFLIKDLGLSELTNFTLIDPLCGSGTLLFESFLFEKNQLFRRFSLDHLIPQDMYKKILKNQLLREKNTTDCSYFGFDNNSKVIMSAIANKIKIQSKYQHIDFNFDVTDLFSDTKFKTMDKINKNIFLICNPPYGDRLKLKEGMNILDYCKKALDKFQPHRAAFILPAHAEILKYQNISNYKKTDQLGFSNNGIRVVFQKYTKDGVVGGE